MSSIVKTILELNMHAARSGSREPVAIVFRTKMQRDVFAQEIAVSMNMQFLNNAPADHVITVAGVELRYERD